MWEPFKKTLLVELLGATSKLEEHVVSQITSEVLSEIADALMAVERMGVRVDSFYNAIEKILKARITRSSHIMFMI